MSRIEGDHAALLDELADRERGRRRVEIEPDERVADPRTGVEHPVGTVEEPVDRGLNGREVRVVGPQDKTMHEGRDFTREWRVPTDRGTFDVSYSIDGTPENRTHTVYVSRSGDGADGSESGTNDGSGDDP